MGIGGGLSGWLADRVGRVRVVWWSVLIFTVFTGVIALCQTYWQIAAMRFVSGFGIGALYTIGTLLAAEYVPTRVRTTVLGALQAGWAVGFVAAALLAALPDPAIRLAPLFACAVVPGVVALALLWNAARAAELGRGAARDRIAAMRRRPSRHAVARSVRAAHVLAVDDRVDRAAVRLLRREHVAAELSRERSRREHAEHGLVRREHLRDDDRRQSRLRLARRHPRAPRRLGGHGRADGVVSAVPHLRGHAHERAIPPARVRLPLRRAVRRQFHLPRGELSGRRSRRRRSPCLTTSGASARRCRRFDRLRRRPAIRSASASRCSASRTRSARSFRACSFARRCSTRRLRHRRTRAARRSTFDAKAVADAAARA